MATKPTEKPEWCTANPTDPISLNPAIIEPSSGKKASGHLRIEKPPRQDHNWLFNLIYKWIDWFDQEVTHNTKHISFPNVLSFDADPTGVVDAISAFDEAWTYDSTILAPEGHYKITSDPGGSFTLPENACLIGSGKGNTILECYGDDIIFKLLSTKLTVKGVTIKQNTGSPTAFFADVTPGESIDLSIEDTEILDMAYGISSTGSEFTGSASTMYTKNLHIEDCTVANIDHGGNDAKHFKSIYMLNLFSSQSNASLINISINSDAGEDPKPILFEHCYIEDGKFILKGGWSASMIWVRGSFINLDSYDLDALGGGFENCQMGDAPNSIVTNSAVYHFKNVQNAGGLMGEDDNIDGISVRYTASAGSSIPDSDNTFIYFNNEQYTKMARNIPFTGLGYDVWDGVNREFTVRGYGSGLVKIEVQVVITGTTVEIDTAKLYEYRLYLNINGIDTNEILKSITNDNGSGDALIFRGSFQRYLDPDDKIKINCYNDSSYLVIIANTTEIRLIGL